MIECLSHETVNSLFLFAAKHNILLYVEDALNQLLEYKDENSKVIPGKFLAD